MMAGLPDFRSRQIDLQQRLRRHRPRTLYRRRLERELRGLIAAELRAELEPAPSVPTPPRHWLQRWRDEQDRER